MVVKKEEAHEPLHDIEYHKKAAENSFNDPFVVPVRAAHLAEVELLDDSVDFGAKFDTILREETLFGSLSREAHKRAPERSGWSHEYHIPVEQLEPGWKEDRPIA